MSPTEREDSMNQNTNVIRQGDLVLIRMGDPIGDVAQAEKVTLAVGEDSGHAHVADGLFDGEILTVVARTDLRVEPDTMAWRHDPIPLDPGQYRVVIQQEYAPAGARRVRD